MHGLTQFAAKFFQLVSRGFARILLYELFQGPNVYRVGYPAPRCGLNELLRGQKFLAVFLVWPIIIGRATIPELSQFRTRSEPNPRA